MIKFERAYEIVMQQPVIPVTETTPLAQSVGRILARDIFSDMDMPPFDKAAVDGYACLRSDPDNHLTAGNNQTDGDHPKDIILRCLETIPAGTIPGFSITPGFCSRIMTGAMVPPGADCVVMVEDTENLGNDLIKFHATKTNPNICHRGEDIRKGDRILNRGILIGPAEVAVMASAGITNPQAYKFPTVGIISTGDELTDPEKIPATGQIRNSNASQLQAQLRQMGIIARDYGIARDHPEAVGTMIEMAGNENQVVLLTGGVSMGDFDFVPAMMKKTGMDILFETIAIQPGKPTVFAAGKNRWIFGLPGNPVSSFVLFEILVKPFLYKLAGHTMRTREMHLPMGAPYMRKKSDRKSLIPAYINDGKVFPASYHGSAHIHAYSGADAILIAEIGTTQIQTGELAHVRLL